MKKLIYLLLLPLTLVNSSCTMIIKGMGKSIAKHYDDHKDMNIGNLELQDQRGNTASFSSLYAGKTVYLYAWKSAVFLPPADKDSNYAALKGRFAKYRDVVFINIYTGNKDDEWQKILKSANKDVISYRLSQNNVNAEFLSITVPAAAPMIVGKDGALLGYNGPQPSDKLLVDYALDQARSGKDATSSAKELIKGINNKLRFKDKKLVQWYEGHYGQKPSGELNVGLSSFDEHKYTDEHKDKDGQK